MVNLLEAVEVETAVLVHPYLWLLFGPVHHNEGKLIFLAGFF